MKPPPAASGFPGLQYQINYDTFPPATLRPQWFLHMGSGGKRETSISWGFSQKARTRTGHTCSSPGCASETTLHILSFWEGAAQNFTKQGDRHAGGRRGKDGNRSTGQSALALPFPQSLPGTEAQSRQTSRPKTWDCYEMRTCSLTQLAHPPEAVLDRAADTCRWESRREAMREMLASVRGTRNPTEKNADLSQTRLESLPGQGCAQK